MKFYDFVKHTQYSPVTVAQMVLYGSKRPLPRLRHMLAVLGCEFSEAERRIIVQVASGNKQAFYDFYEKPAQTDISNQSSLGMLEHYECGNEMSL